MPVAWAIGGAALLGYMGSQQQAGAATSAAGQQYAATQDAARVQREMFDILNKQQEGAMLLHEQLLKNSSIFSLFSLYRS
jgi:hypothetical protein